MRAAPTEDAAPQSYFGAWSARHTHVAVKLADLGRLGIPSHDPEMFEHAVFVLLRLDVGDESHFILGRFKQQVACELVGEVCERLDREPMHEAPDNLVSVFKQRLPGALRNEENGLASVRQLTNRNVEAYVLEAYLAKYALE